MTMAFRASGPTSTVTQDLGLLAEFRGTWVGSGFNLIGRPFFNNAPPFFLELNATNETLEFSAIGGDIPNRGSKESDINLHGLRYLQRVSDCTLHSDIHIEPGLWVRVPPTTAPNAGETYVRQATIPHGDALLAQSTFATTVNGGLPALNADPATPVTDSAYLAQYLNGKLPPDCLPKALDPAKTIKDPTEVIRADIAGQTITSTVVIAITTVTPGNPAGSIVNIPFVQQNANAA
jgi:hypothetical protein